MSEKIDIFTLLPLDSPYFDVDTTKLSVPLKRPSVLAEKMYSSGANTKFAAGDNFTVLSAGFIFPESFSLASAPANKQQTSLALNLGAASIVGGHGTTEYFPNFGQSGIQLPLENYETPLGVYVNIMNVGGPEYYMRTEQFNLKGTLRGPDETYMIPNNYNPTPSLPVKNVMGDTYTATATANGWTSGKVYQYNGGTTGTASDWNDVTGVAEVLAQISMVGVPSVLNGRRMRVTVFTKILHTLPLTA